MNADTSPAPLSARKDDHLDQILLAMLDEIQHMLDEIQQARRAPKPEGRPS
jgi:hypothetical protein